MSDLNGGKSGPNGTWRTWLLGITATIIGSLIIGGIAFQRDTREHLAQFGERLKHDEQRIENVLKFLTQRTDENRAYLEREVLRLERRVEELERRK